jgi:ubiquinone biosynthesis protein
MRAGWIFVREGVFAELDPTLLPPALQTLQPVLKLFGKRRRGPSGSTLPRAMERLGPSYVKLGQFLATRPDIVGMATARSLESLRDRMPPFPTATAIEIVEASLGAPLERHFSSFDESVAAASIAQVHRATIGAGADAVHCAVKIARPGIERRFAKDLGDMRFAARLAESGSDEAQRLRVVEVVETLARSVKLEMDFRLEAAAAAELAANCKDDDDFRVPSVDWDRTARHVLTTEWIDGIALSDLPAIRASGLDQSALARMVIQSFLRHAMRDGFFHADMHQGNLFADAQGRLVAVDFGIMGRLGPKEQRFLAEILFGFITKDYLRVSRVHFDAGYVPAHHSVEEFAQAIRAIGEPIHARRADEISMARLFTLLFEVTSLFQMRTRPELVLLQKTMVVVEGVARALDPHLDIWKTSEPVVREWIEDNLGPGGQIKHAAAGLGDLLQAASRLPALISRAETLAERLETVAEQGIAIAPSAMRGIEHAQARAARLGHWALWLLVAAVLVLLYRWGGSPR